MDRIARIISAVLLQTAFLSCGDFLDESPLSDFTAPAGGEVTGFKDIGEAQSALNGAYSKFMTDLYQFNIFLIGDVMTDNCYVGGDGVNEEQFDKLSVSPTNSVIALSWKQYYELAGTASSVIARAELMADDKETRVQRNRIVAEAKFIRAWAYFDIVRLWGDAPVTTGIVTSLTDSDKDAWYPAVYPERTPAEDIYAMILDDLDDSVIESLPGSGSGCFHATKGAAYGLRAKVSATMGEKSGRDYAAVVSDCDKVMDEGYSLVGDFDLLWQPDGEFSTESIFEISFDKGSMENWAYRLLLTDKDGEISVSWRRYCTPSHDLLARFDKQSDSRYASSVFWTEVPYSIYYPADNYPLSYKIRSRMSNIILLRLADILLLKAEALVELGRPKEALAIVNDIRSRAGAAPVDENMDAARARLAVENERQLELYMEGHRWFDLIRNDRMEEVMGEATDKYGNPIVADAAGLHRLMPIPQNQIDINENLAQNEGY